MANKKDNTKRYDVAHLRNLARYRAQVDAIYRTLTKEAAAIAAGIDTEMSEDVFSFADYPKTMKRVDALIAKYKADMQKVIVNGVKSEWTLANNKNNELARQVFGGKAGKLTAEQERRYFKNNDTAREAFLGRKERGLSLSDRVWNYSDKFKNEIELGVDLCLRKGMPAAEMARELQKYLKHPNELFRRVRDEHGVLKLSQAAKDFHPGRGVYRSSYKNALRLAITETNMAYRLADWERWQQMDFVVGIRIQLSNNHTCLGTDGNPHPFYDICDELEGEYPKTFKWTGWHPQCRCNAVPILKTVNEKIADNIAKRNGQAPAKESVNSVKRMPKAFTEWLKDNKTRIAAAKSQPYFIRDNAAAVAKIIPGVLPESMAPAIPVIPIAERAQMRHDARTPEEIADIKRRWTLREAEIRHASRTKEQIEAIQRKWDNYKLYIETKENSNYKDVVFDFDNGGMKATHIHHNFDKAKGNFEKDVQNVGFAYGNAVILESEYSTKIGERFTEGLWNGKRFEIATRETATDNNILRGLEHCADKRNTQYAVLYFPNGGFTKDKLEKAKKRYKGFANLPGRTYTEFERIICIENMEIVYDEAF